MTLSSLKLSSLHANDGDDELPQTMTPEEVIRRSKMAALEHEEMMEEAPELGKEVEMEMDEEEIQLVEEGMAVASIEENHEKQNKAQVQDEQELPMRIVKNWKRPEERIAAERDPTRYVVSPITKELIPIEEMAEHMRISLIDPKYKEQKERMMAKIRETTLAQDDEISRNIVGLARTRPDIFGTTEEEVSNAVKAEIEKKKDEQPKQVIRDGHTGSMSRTATQAMSQNTIGDQNSDSNISDGKILPGPAPLHRPGVPSMCPLPPPPGLALNLPRPPTMAQSATPLRSGLVMQQPLPGPPMISMISTMRPPPPPINLGGQPMILRPPPPPIPGSVPSAMTMPPPPGSQFTPLGVPRPPYPMLQPMRAPLPSMPAMPPPLPQGMPPPPPEEAPLPDDPEPKRQKVDDASLIPEDQFLAQHQGSIIISVSVPNVDEGNLKGQVLEITMLSLSQTVGNLKEKITGEIQLLANKQKLSGKAGFLKDILSLAYYNIGPGEALALALRERGGRKK